MLAFPHNQINLWEMEWVKRTWGTACFAGSLIFSTGVAIAAERRRNDPITDWIRLRYLPFLASGAITDLALRTIRFQITQAPDVPLDTQVEQKSWFAFALMNVLAHLIWIDTDACLFSAFTAGCSFVWAGRGIICP